MHYPPIPCPVALLPTTVGVFPLDPEAGLFHRSLKADVGQFPRRETYRIGGCGARGLTLAVQVFVAVDHAGQVIPTQHQIPHGPTREVSRLQNRLAQASHIVAVGEDAAAFAWKREKWGDMFGATSQSSVVTIRSRAIISRNVST